MGVGKTALIHRYVLDRFSDNYTPTLGAKVIKKQIMFDLPKKREFNLMMTVWDIMGERELLGVARDLYFRDATGLMAVYDLTREETLPALADWLRAASEVVASVPVVIVANKLDLIPRKSIKTLSDGLSAFAEENNASRVLASAKTGDNVELAFRKLGVDIIDVLLKKDGERGLAIETQ